MENGSFHSAAAGAWETGPIAEAEKFIRSGSGAGNTEAAGEENANAEAKAGAGAGKEGNAAPDPASGTAAGAEKGKDGVYFPLSGPRRGEKGGLGRGARDVMDDLVTLTRRALEDGAYNSALRGLELQSRLLGLDRKQERRGYSGYWVSFADLDKMEG